MSDPQSEASSFGPDPVPATLRAVARGRVQGVGFRYFVLREARRLGLAGSVRNLYDGGVEVLARGDKADLLRLLEALRRGPLLSRVEGVEAAWGVEVPQISDFEIGY